MDFNSLPQAVEALQADMALIKQLMQNLPTVVGNTQDEFFTIDQCAQFLHLQKATVYIMVSEKRIPFMKQGKKLVFSKNDLMAWLKSSSRKVREVV